MSRSIKTIEGQNTYDLSIQQFGTLNNIDKVLRQIPDINSAVPFGTSLVFEGTNNNLAISFEANNDRFATGVESPLAPVFETFDDTFDDTFF